MPSHVRRRVLGFLIHSAQKLLAPPIVKYTALSFFADRFLPSLSRKCGALSGANKENWLIRPVRESNLQLFALVSIWISSKLHCACPLSVNSVKYLGNKFITDQCFTARDYVEAELVFMRAIRFEIGASNVTCVFLEDLLIQFRELSRLGEHVNFRVCMDIMDLLYETEETSMLYESPHSLAASVLVASYILTVPKQQSEFPLLPWVKFVTCYKEEDIGALVKYILKHVMKLTEKQAIDF